MTKTDPVREVLFAQGRIRLTIRANFSHKKLRHYFTGLAAVRVHPRIICVTSHVQALCVGGRKSEPVKCAVITLLIVVAHLKIVTMILNQEVEKVLLESIDVNEELAIVEVFPSTLFFVAGSPSRVLVIPWSFILLESPWVL